MKTIEEQIKLMQHFTNGGKVERISLMNQLQGWKPVVKETVFFDYYHYDYRIAVEIDPYAELKAAVKDPTKQIRCYPFADNNSDWVNSDKGDDWTWCYRPDQYQIRDKPKTVKKVKFLAYTNDIGLFWRHTHIVAMYSWKRVPSEDKEIELEE